MGSEDLRAGCGVLPARPTADAPQTGLKATAADGLAWVGAPAAGGPGWHVSAAREESPGQVGTRMSAGSTGEEGLRVAAPCSSQLLCWRTWRSSPIYIAFVVPLLSCTCSATPKGDIIPLLPRWLRVTLSLLSWENINRWTTEQCWMARAKAWGLGWFLWVPSKLCSRWKMAPPRKNGRCQVESAVTAPQRSAHSFQLHRSWSDEPALTSSSCTGKTKCNSGCKFWNFVDF